MPEQRGRRSRRVGHSGTHRRPRRAFLRAGAGALGAVGVAGLAGCAALTGGSRSRESITVFHAGSLSAPFEDAERAFEEAYDVDVHLEALGSVGSTKKITEQGRQADVLGVSDFRLLRDVLLPEFGDWYAVFATNAMTIAYTEQSTAVDEFGPDTWWEVLGRDDVVFAHSDPAVDPNGYRAVMSMQLGATPFRGERLYGRDTYRRLRERERVPSGTETDLIGQLQSGKLDYAWQYQSARASHDLRIVDLQPSVDLSRTTEEYADHYAKAEVETESDTFTGAPIAYGITVPSVAGNPEGGAKWVEFVLTGEGREILRANGFGPVAPAVVPARTKEAVPERVLAHVEAREGMGPLQLGLRPPSL